MEETRGLVPKRNDGRKKGTNVEQVFDLVENLINVNDLSIFMAPDDSHLAISGTPGCIVFRWFELTNKKMNQKKLTRNIIYIQMDTLPNMAKYTLQANISVFGSYPRQPANRFQNFVPKKKNKKNTLLFWRIPFGGQAKEKMNKRQREKFRIK